MKIVLAAVNARFTHSSLALRYLRNALEAAGAGPVDCREYWLGQDRLRILRDLVLAEPDALLLSVQIWNSRLVAGLLPDLRRLLPGCRLILGGPEVSWNAAAWLERLPMVDLIVSGEGESAMAELAAAGFDCAALAPGRVLAGRPAELDSLPFPYRDEDYPALRDRYLYFETSRGCPFACAYCLSSREEQAQRAKPAAAACADLDRLVAARPMLVKLVDRTFNADPARARAIWRHLIERRPEGTGFHFEIHPALLEDADFELLAAAPPGLFRFEIGVQSVNPKTLAAVGRPVDWAAAAPAVARLAALGNSHVHLDLIAGLPAEDLAAFGRSFDAVMALRPHHFQLGFLKGLPGTALGDRPAEHGLEFSAEPPYQILRSRWLSPAELAELADVEELVENLANTHVLDAELERAAAELGSAFALFRSLAAYARRGGFDIRTRHAPKLRAFFAAWQAEAGGTGAPAPAAEPR